MECRILYEYDIGFNSSDKINYRSTFDCRRLRFDLQGKCKFHHQEMNDTGARIPYWNTAYSLKLSIVHYQFNIRQ